MTFIEKVGNLRVFADKNIDGSWSISFMNGSDIVASEVYFHATKESAIEALFSTKFDTYTEEWLWLNTLTDGLVKVSENTYYTSDTDWFCRIDDTKYFKHFNKSVDEFVTDKDGLRIIDR